MDIQLKVNGTTHTADVDPESPLLWVLRDTLHLVGTKFGCGIGQCGACTVHFNGAPMRSCQLPATAAQGQSVTTVEGLANGPELSAVQQAWIEHDVAQCGYCQAGQIMAATALLQQVKLPTDAQIDTAMAGNICRCGTYLRIRAAIRTASRTLTTGARSPR